MKSKQPFQVRALAVLAMGYLVSLLAYPNLPGPFLEQKVSARILVAFTLPTTALVIYTLFRSLWNHDRIRARQRIVRTAGISMAFHLDSQPGLRRQNCSGGNRPIPLSPRSAPTGAVQGCSCLSQAQFKTVQDRLSSVLADSVPDFSRIVWRKRRGNEIHLQPV